MEIKEIIEGLRDLIKDRESFIQKDEEDCIFKHDIEVLKGAIEIIEKNCSRSTGSRAVD